MDIFERASRGQLRFTTPQGLLSTEQLWGLPLTSKLAGRANLDAMAREVFGELRELEQGSFVELKPDPRKADRELQLAILKHVIASNLADKAAAEKRQEFSRIMGEFSEASEHAARMVAHHGGTIADYLAPHLGGYR